MPAPGPFDSPHSLAVIAVAIGQWAVAAAPAKIRTLLGSCVGVVLYDRTAKLGGVAHIVLPRRGVPLTTQVSMRTLRFQR